jgi:hypothetical protein
MPLSPYETRILERIEEDLRTDDPNLAAALSVPAQPVRRGPEMLLARRAPGTVEPLHIRRAALHLFAALVLVAVAITPPAWSGVIPLVLTFVLLCWLPRLVERSVVWVERRRDRVRPGRLSR